MTKLLYQVNEQQHARIIEKGFSAEDEQDHAMFNDAANMSWQVRGIPFVLKPANDPSSRPYLVAVDLTDDAAEEFEVIAGGAKWWCIPVDVANEFFWHEEE